VTGDTFDALAATLAVLSLGESWHNMHHSEPSCARHGVDRGQLDLSAALIRVLERLRWVTSVRWPDRARLDRRRRLAGDAVARTLGPGQAPGTAA
jgi:fatty-acid desaturase